MSSCDVPIGRADPTSERVWREFGAQLRAFVHRRVADPQRAEDVVGEIVLRIHQNLRRLDNQKQLISWLFRIARNAIVDEYRRAGRDRERLESIAGDAPAQVWDEDQSSVLSELARCLRPLLDALPPEQQRAVQSADLEGVTQVRAAQLEGVSVSGMKSRVQRGRHRLAELLGECCALTLDARGVPMDYVAPVGCACARDAG